MELLRPWYKNPLYIFFFGACAFVAFAYFYYFFSGPPPVQEKSQEGTQKAFIQKDEPVIMTSSSVCPYCGAEGKELSKKYLFVTKGQQSIPMICSRYGDKHMWVYVVK